MSIPQILPVSVIIAAYNAEKTIERAVVSALNEGAQQVIVVDDASSDNTLSIMNLLFKEESRVTVLAQDQNRGPSAARNTAIEHVKADWIAILDADDFFAQGRLEKLLEYSNDADLIADHRWSVLEQEDVATHISLEALSLEKEYISFEEFIERNITTKNASRQELGFIKPIIRVKLLKSLNLSYRDDMRLGEDFELYARALFLKARLLIIPFRGYVSVVRPNSLSGKHSIKDLTLLRDSLINLKNDSLYVNMHTRYSNIILEHFNNVNCRLQWRLLIEAVKNRNVIDILKCFCHKPPVPLYLADKLWEQVNVRLLK